jgi:hypothetical protein
MEAQWVSEAAKAARLERIEQTYAAQRTLLEQAGR